MSDKESAVDPVGGSPKMETGMRLSGFIAANAGLIIEAWEAFAKTILPQMKDADRARLRDHIKEILHAITEDISSAQTRTEQADKSKGWDMKRPEDQMAIAAKEHAIQRVIFKFGIGALVSEYRALRASVVRLWGDAAGAMDALAFDDFIRFHEALDELVYGAVGFYHGHAQNQIERLNRLYLLLYHVHEAIIHARAAEDLLPAVCRLILLDGGFDSVWIGLDEPGSTAWKPVAHTNVPDPPGESFLSAKARMLQGAGPPNTALRAGRPYVCNDTTTDPNSQLWRSQAGDERILAWAAFPLMIHREALCGVLSICAVRAGAFDHETAELLAELAANLSLALDRFELMRQREESAALLRDNAERLRLSAQVIEHCGEGIMITSRDNRIVSVNPAFTKITGYTADEAVGRNPRLLKSGRHGRDFYRGVWDAIATTGGWRGEIWNRRKDGQVYPALLSISTLRDDAGTIQYHVSLFTDITEQKRTEEAIRTLAYYDPLTRLPNRMSFQERLATALAQAERHRQSMAVLVLDLDHFKNINDSLGHLAGDALLREAARRMKRCVREQDTVARPGGDEFMLILPETGTEGAAHAAEKIVKSLAAPMRIEEHELRVSCSLGISLFPNNGRDSNSLIQCADAAMYRAKQAGRNAYRFYTDAMHEEAMRALTLEQHLQQAMSKGEFILYYQPQVDIHSGRPIGCETLLRWLHPDWGMVATDRFIPVAEENGMILDIGRWVLLQAARQLKAWERAGMAPLLMSVNLSATQFRHHHNHFLKNQIAMVLEETGVSPECLELEITESTLMEDTPQTLKTLRDLKDMGIHLAIDDFGIGYSSLGYLKRFPIDRLKIDRSFVRDIAVDPDDEAIVDTVIGLGRNFGMKVIAEGVETEQQLEKLRDKGCDEAQGFYFSRPLPIEELEAWLPGNRV